MKNVGARVLTLNKNAHCAPNSKALLMITGAQRSKKTATLKFEHWTMFSEHTRRLVSHRFYRKGWLLDKHFYQISKIQVTSFAYKIYKFEVVTWFLTLLTFDNDIESLAAELDLAVARLRVQNGAPKFRAHPYGEAGTKAKGQPITKNCVPLFSHSKCYSFPRFPKFSGVCVSTAVK